MLTKNPLQRAVGGLIAGVAVLVPLVFILAKYVPGNMAAGAATGGGVVIIGFTIAAWRAARRPQQATTLERAITGGGDERDQSVMTRSAAVVGLASLPLTALATSAVAIGAAAEIVLPVLLYALVFTAVLSFYLINRKA